MKGLIEKNKKSIERMIAVKLTADFMQTLMSGKVNNMTFSENQLQKFTSERNVRFIRNYYLCVFRAKL